MQRPIRVAMITQGYLPLVGGAERQLASVAPRLMERGVRVDVVTRRHPGLAPFEVIDGVPVHRLPLAPSKPLASLGFTAFALPLLRRLQPDVIHAYGLFSTATTALLAKHLFGTPVTIKILRTGAPFGDLNRLHCKVWGRYRWAAMRRGVDAFVAISRETAAELSASGVLQERCWFIPNGVDTARFQPIATAERRALRQALALPEDAPVVVFTGRLEPEKRIAELLTIWPEIRAAHPDALLILVGGGSETERLRASAGDGVQMVGAVDDVAPYIRAADLFVLPSAAEGLSNALLEALASGLPAVATAVGGNTDLIESGDNGLLVPVDDAPALAAAIKALLADPERRAHLGQRAREHVRAEFDITVAVDRLEALYRRLTAASADRLDPSDLRDLPAVLPAIERGARPAHAGEADE